MSKLYSHRIMSGIAMVCALFVVVLQALAKDEAKQERTAESAIQSMLRNLESHNRGKWQDVADARLDEYTVFGAGGGLLRPNNRDELRDAFKDGFGSDLRAEHIDCKLYGDTAVLTAYYVGKWFLEDGKVVDGFWRFSEVRIWKDGKWRIAHTHFSPAKPSEMTFSKKKVSDSERPDNR